jgi:KipI family sensor histidine kinase inhibitor
MAGTSTGCPEDAAMIVMEPLGEHAFLARFNDETAAAGWARAVRARSLPGVVDIVLAYSTAAVFTDPAVIDPATVALQLRAIEPEPAANREGRLVTVPVLYDGEDLEWVASQLSRSPEEVVARHAQGEYHVFAMGFLPGFPYAGYLPPELAGLPRRESPRPRVGPGSVAIVGRQTGIYPGESPGGWHLLGRTPLVLVDVESGYFPIQAGDRLRFEPITTDAYQNLLGRRL